MDGLVIINKCEGLTSQAVVNRVKRLFGVQKAGHTGTLDPMATGVLPVLVGRGVKASEFMLTSDKHYIATLLLGVTTDTEDVTGEVLSECREMPSADAVAEACRAFVGEIKQVPPMYSALKVNGQKLYDLARRGVVIEREAREITIYSLECRATERADEYELCVVCSGGTYIRTLCADIGASLGCGGVMAALKRVEACGITIGECHSLDEIEAMCEDERQGLLMPTEKLFEELYEVRLSAFFERLFRGGCPIYQKKIRTSLKVGTRVRVCSEDGGFFALGEVVEAEEGSAIKSVKIFELK